MSRRATVSEGAARFPWLGMIAAVAILGLLSFVSVAPPETVGTRSASDPTGEEGDFELGEDGSGLGDQEQVGPASASARGGGSRQAGAAAGLECAPGKNGGATDKGVTSNRIRLASTNVRSGVGSSFLGQSWIGMQAVVNKVNASGGICGRLLELRVVDDGWDASRGRQFIEQFINEDYFALPVVPSSEGLTAAIRAGVIKNSKVPVIGSDGMLKEQYQDPYVWPVAAATVTTMRVIAKHAYDSGARTFGIVWDNRYRFGREGAAAFRDYVGTLSGASLKADVDIAPNQASYSGEAQRFNDACNPRCEAVAMLLDPSTATTWISSHPDREGRRMGFGSKTTSGAQPLFNERFARECGVPCDGMLVWSGYNPPVGPIANQPGVAEYVNDVRSVDPGVDIYNQFLEGSYLGMRVFSEVLRKIGPGLTRQRVAEEMNSFTYQSDLSPTLKWTGQSRFANTGARAFAVVVSGGSFAGFRDAGTNFISDPTPGVVPKE